MITSRTLLHISSEQVMTNMTGTPGRDFES
jgi:hypothetical protein